MTIPATLDGQIVSCWRQQTSRWEEMCRLLRKGTRYVTWKKSMGRAVRKICEKRGKKIFFCLEWQVLPDKLEGTFSTLCITWFQWNVLILKTSVHFTQFKKLRETVFINIPCYPHTHLCEPYRLFFRSLKRSLCIIIIELHCHTLCLKCLNIFIIDDKIPHFNFKYKFCFVKSRDLQVIENLIACKQ